MSRKKIEFIFADGTHPIVKYKDFEKNYIFWLKEFLYKKTKLTLPKRMKTILPAVI